MRLAGLQSCGVMGFLLIPYLVCLGSDADFEVLLASTSISGHMGTTDLKKVRYR
jgi:hypothetical protein